MKIKGKTFGLLSNGKKVHLYTIKAGDLSLSVSTLGAAWTSLYVPQAKKGKSDILLGYSSFDGYTRNNNFFGVTAGRYAGRIGGGRFSLGGKEYNLSKNSGENTIHGGRFGFDKKIWNAEAYEEKDGVFLRLELKSKDGDQGFPGNLDAAVCYGLTKSNEVVCDYEASIDAKCPVNITNYAYFNLAGEESGLDVLSTELTLHSSSRAELDNKSLPTGKILPVEGTPFDFRKGKSMGKDLTALSQKGYDNYFIVDGEAGELRPFAEVFDGVSGRIMRVFSTQPGVQFYTGNAISPMQGKIGSVYDQYGAFCLAPQHFPDSPNQKGFPQAIFGPLCNYHEKAVFAFDW